MTEREAIDLARSLNLRCPSRVRAPGRRLLIILGEIADAHLRGVRWMARATGREFAVWKIMNRAGYAHQLHVTYRWIEGTARRGYALIACPLCQVVTCFGSECPKESGHDARA